MSGPAIVVARNLPEGALDAAAQFHAAIVPIVREKAGASGLVVIDFTPADHTHDGWRQAAVAQLARELAPVRVNAVASNNTAQAARAEVIAYLVRAPGVTGQVLAVDGNSAENG